MGAKKAADEKREEVTPEEAETEESAELLPLALGINGVAAVAGSSIGLVLGGVLAPVAWRAVFLVSVPFGIFGTVVKTLRDITQRTLNKEPKWRHTGADLTTGYHPTTY